LRTRRSPSWASRPPACTGCDRCKPGFYHNETGCRGV